MIRWRLRERAALRRAAEHEGRRVVLAADWAITVAVRRTPLDERVVVTPDDVRRWAAENFLLDVPEDLAADVLTARLRLRGYA